MKKVRAFLVIRDFTHCTASCLKLSDGAGALDFNGTSEVLALLKDHVDAIASLQIACFLKERQVYKALTNRRDL